MIAGRCAEARGVATAIDRWKIPFRHRCAEARGGASASRSHWAGLKITE